MAQPRIPMTEFARRLCLVAHPQFGTAGPVPCGTHVAAAQRWWLLITDEGSDALRTILEVRREEGMAIRLLPALRRRKA